MFQHHNVYQKVVMDLKYIFRQFVVNIYEWLGHFLLHLMIFWLKNDDMIHQLIIYVKSAFFLEIYRPFINIYHLFISKDV